MRKRRDYELVERQLLSPYAKKSSQSMGRKKAETEDEFRTCFQRDRDRILHSKAFRRLKHKTQVYVSPEGDHYRTRLTHTLEVSQIARTIGRALQLNEDLIEAIALGHDLGHTPFGHTGEGVLNELSSTGFKHYEQSVRVVELLESKPSRIGLNLSAEVIDGIANHTGSRVANTLEGKVIKYADRIAYINHDIDDSIRAGILSEAQIPINLRLHLGQSGSERIATLVSDLIRSSHGKDDILMSPDIEEDMLTLRSFMFDTVYLNPTVKRESDRAAFVMGSIFEYYSNHPDRLPQSHLSLYEHSPEHKDDTTEQKIIDYIAGMTDRYVLHHFDDLFMPNAWVGRRQSYDS